uniref:DUF2809 domain-containing protein n=1 Tax=Roseihalotalea indica TaxID=2867963 RepID=A0AA49GQV4_9BACT|nr:DUF2809 domain-containing protein [Tunicatimonas sp. TK19036]
MLRFSLKFFLLTLLFFMVEVLIALFVRDRFIRPYGGDYLVVFLVYCAVSTFLKAPPWKIALGVLLFSYAVEALQYVNFIGWIGLSDNQLAKTVLGYGFEWLDLLAYTCGIATILILERLTGT